MVVFLIIPIFKKLFIRYVIAFYLYGFLGNNLYGLLVIPIFYIFIPSPLACTRIDPTKHDDA